MIYIVRHGQTQMNSRKVMQSRSDQLLNEAGRTQARELGQRLAARGIVFDRIFSSPRSRAVETAQLVAPGVEVVCDERLAEMDYGPYEGTDLSALPSELAAFFSDFVHNPAPDGMEPLSSVIARTGELIDEIATLPGTTLVSTHAVAMKGILEHLTPDANGFYWSKYIGNCGIYACEGDGTFIGVPYELEVGAGQLGM